MIGARLLTIGKWIAGATGAAGWLPSKGAVIGAAAAIGLSTAFLGGWMAHRVVVAAAEARALKAAHKTRLAILKWRERSVLAQASRIGALEAELAEVREKARKAEEDGKGEAGELTEKLGHARKRASDLEARLRRVPAQCFDNGDPWLQHHRQRARRSVASAVPASEPGRQGGSWKDRIAARRAPHATSGP